MDTEVIALLIRNRRNRELLESELGDRYDIERLTTADDVSSTQFDILLVDESFLEQARSGLQEKADAAFPLPLPVVLLRPPDSSRLDPDVWEAVDDVIQLPTSQANLTARVENLLHTRTLARDYHETQERLQSVVETASDSVLILDADLTVVFVNPATETLFGIENDGLVGVAIESLFPDEEGPAVRDRLGGPLDDDAIGEQPPGTIETTVCHESGKEIPAQISYDTFDHDGEVFITAVIHDVSDLKQRELRLQVLNRILRHDIRNDINVIEGYVELAATEGSIAHEHLEAIRENVREITDLSEKARQLDYLFETTNNPLTDIDIVPVVERVVSGHEASHPAVTFEVDLPDRAVVSGVTLLSSALDNLVENAIEHNDETGLTVSVSVTVDDQHVTVEVADTGNGIPDDEVAVLEQQEETAIEHASGLGLWLVNWLVRASNGDIRFQPNEPTGSRIIVTLDRAAE